MIMAKLLIPHALNQPKSSIKTLTEYLLSHGNCN